MTFRRKTVGFDLMRIALFFLLCVEFAIAEPLFAAGNFALPVSHTYDNSECGILDRKIERLEARRRNGYSAKEGEHLKKKLREARKEWREYGCKRTGV